MGSNFEICCPPEDVARASTISNVAKNAKIKVATEDEHGNEIAIEAPKIKDLAPASYSGKDAYQKFEISLPFGQISADAFFTAVEIAHTNCNKEGFVTIDALAEVLNTPAWAQLKQSDSKLVKVLLHPAFKNQDEGHGAEQIDVNYLQIYGYLLCAGKPKDKVEVLFNILQEGGLAKHTYIGALDDDFLPTFRKICRFATIHIFEFANDFSGLVCPFENKIAELIKVIDDDDEENSLQAELLDSVYGKANNRLDYKPWADKICDKADWFFSASELRKKIMEKAGVKYEMPK